MHNHVSKWQETLLEPLAGHEDCSSNEPHACNSLCNLAEESERKTWSQNGNIDVTCEHASSGLQIHGTLHYTAESQCQSILWRGCPSSKVSWTETSRGSTESTYPSSPDPPGTPPAHPRMGFIFNPGQTPVVHHSCSSGPAGTAPGCQAPSAPQVCAAVAPPFHTTTAYPPHRNYITLLIPRIWKSVSVSVVLSNSIRKI